MLTRATLDRCRILLGAAIVVKGAAFVVAPLHVRAMFLLLGALVIANRWPRVAFAGSAGLSWVVLLTDQYYANHFALMAILTTMAVFVAWEGGPTMTPIGPVLMMAQVSAVYFWAGAWKVNAEFLSGAVLLFEWGQAWAVRAPLSPWLATALAIIAVITEIGLAGALWVRRWARTAVILGLGLHLGMVLTVGSTWVTRAELVSFALLCASTYPLFLHRAHAATTQDASVETFS